MKKRLLVFLLEGIFVGLLLFAFTYNSIYRNDIDQWENKQETEYERRIRVSDGSLFCDCPARIVMEESASPGAHSTCSDVATARGPHQRVVSFNFYGDVDNWRQYFQGIERNALLMPSSYPGWVMRVYHDLPPKHPALCQLGCKFPFLDFCDARNVSGFGNVMDKQRNTWRFIPMADPLVDVVVCRDLDSFFTERELMAVDEWLRSNLTFHAMRDNNWHSLQPILAGMWGAKLDQRREDLRHVTHLVTGVKHSRKFNTDQMMLWKHLWPRIKDDVLQHDSYSCLKFASHGHVRAFPTRRNVSQVHNWVGSRVNKDRVPMRVECPEACRPPDHKDWIYC